MFALRPYQTAAVRAALESIDTGKRTLCVLPTGAGKTVIAAEIIRHFADQGARIGFLAHRQELIRQTSAKLDEAGIPHGIIRANDLTRLDYRHAVQVCSTPTLINRLDLQFRFDLLIQDESHRIMAATNRRIMAAFPSARVLGLTATPYRSDGQGLAEMFDTLIVGATVAGLVADWFLVPTRVFRGQAPDLSGVRSHRGEFDEADVELRVRRPHLLGNILQTWLMEASDRQTIGFAHSVPHSRDLAERFRAAGVPTEHLDANTPDGEREAIVGRFRDGLTRVLWNVGIFTEGFDAPWCSAIIDAAPTASRGLHKQKVGRVMRPWPGKVDGILLDHTGGTRLHGLPDAPEDYDLAGCTVKAGPERGAGGNGQGKPRELLIDESVRLVEIGTVRGHTLWPDAPNTAEPIHIKAGRERVPFRRLRR